MNWRLALAVLVALLCWWLPVDLIWPDEPREEA